MSLKPLFFSVGAGLVVLVLVSGCARLGPDYRRPDIGVIIPESFQHAPSGMATLQAQDKWWLVFGDRELNQLVEEVLANNLDIKKAAAAILEIRSRFIQTRADRFPSLGFQGRQARQHQHVTVTSGFGSVSTLREFDTFTLSLPVSFELDLWGRLARAEEAARADLLQAEESRWTVAQTVAAETVSLYLEIESLERRIQLAGRSVENYRRSLVMAERRYKRGLTPVLALRQSRRMLAQAEASLPNLRQNLGLAQQKLAVLLGRYPRTSPPRSQPEDYFKRLAPVPPGLPSELLKRRPDIRAAEAMLKALNARIGVAKASRFPSISLTGSFGYSSEEFDRLLRPQSELWNLALGIVQPLFNAGKLTAVQRAAEARYKQGAADYAKKVLTAFLEIEGALLRRKEQLEQRDKVLEFLREARATQEVAETRYERGLTDYLSVLEAQQTRFRAEENLVMVDLAIMTNRVTLHRALGGGWAEPVPEAAKSENKIQARKNEPRDH